MDCISLFAASVILEGFSFLGLKQERRHQIRSRVVSGFEGIRQIGGALEIR